MSKSAESDIEKLLEQLPDRIAKAIREGEAEPDISSEAEFDSEELPYPYNLEGTEQSDW